MNNSFKIISLVIIGFFLQLNLVYTKENICKSGQECNKVYTKDDIFRLERECRTNNAESCHRLGYLYISGEDIKQDYVKGRKYSEKACHLNNGFGCHNLGYLYQNGLGLEKNLSKAEEYFSKACGAKEKVSCDLADALKAPLIPIEVWTGLGFIMMILTPDIINILKKLKNRKNS